MKWKKGPEPQRRGPTGKFAKLKEDWRHEFIQRGIEDSSHSARRKGNKPDLNAALRDLGVGDDLGDVAPRPSVALTSPAFELHEQQIASITKGEAALEMWMKMQERKKGPKIATPTTIQQLYLWLDRASKGSWCLYWEGYLAYDVDQDTRQGTRGEYPPASVRRAMWEGYMSGRLELYQKRIGVAHYRYWAKRVDDLPVRIR